MNILRFFYGINLILIFCFTGCRDHEKKTTTDIAAQLRDEDYSQRINNIFAYIKQSKFNIDVNACSNIVILQTNLCNSCNKEKIETILDSLKNITEPIYFILADKKEEIIMQVSAFNKTSGIYIDTMQLLQNNNLSFLKNIKINICKEKIVRWSFI